MSSAKYDMLLNPVYQVDFSTSTKGKRFALTKRTARFSFGFSNADAFAQGLKGIHCRGEEHEVTLVWSLTSGKRLVTADGVEVHYSKGKRTELRFECSWTMKGDHVMKLVAHATPAFLSNKPNFRQFELFLDGMSFFSMPKIFELGVVSGKEILNRATRTRTATTVAPISDERGRITRDLHAQNRDYASNPYRAPSVMDVQPPPQARQEAPRIQAAPPRVVSQPVPVQDLLASPAPAVLPEQHSSFNYAPVRDEFAPVKPPPPTYNDVANQILHAYGPAPSAPVPSHAPALLALPYEPHTYHVPALPQQSTFASQPHSYAPQPNNYAPQPNNYAQQPISYAQQPNAFASQPISYAPQPNNFASQSSTNYASSTGSLASGSTTPTGGFFQSSINEHNQPEHATLEDSPTSVRLLSDVEKAMNCLVNLDDLNEPVVSPLKLTMQQEKEEKKRNEGKSRPLPPVASWNVGSQAPLSAIKASSQRVGPSRDVMRVNAMNQAGAQGNMLVVYGATPNQAPPLQPVYHPYGRASLAH